MSESTIFVTVLGASFIAKGGKLAYGFQPCDAEGIPSDLPAIHFANQAKLITAGVYEVMAVYSDKGELDGLFLNTLNYLGQVVDSDKEATIRLESDAIKTEHAARSQAKKAVNDKTVILDALKPLRKAWANTNAVGKMALEVRILNYLRNGKDL